MTDLRLIKQKAKNGDGEAAYILGRSYCNGENGVRADAAKGFRFYEAGSKLTNSALCLFGLGVCYYNGLFKAKDPNIADQYFSKAYGEVERQAKAGGKYGQYALGCYYDFSLGGVAKDPFKAVYWYGAAAAQDEAGAVYNLAHCCEKGEGTDLDLEKAADLYAFAAAMGIAGAAENLAVLRKKERSGPSPV